MALSTQRASAESARRGWKYDVFLNFRGTDIRKGFLSHLYDKLQGLHWIATFKDDPELEGGSSIARELFRAIKESHMAIVIFSPDYASSRWCLNELKAIFKCMKARKTILPVFYKVEPSDVGNQSGIFGKAFTKHTKKLISPKDKRNVAKWKVALEKVSKLSGWPLTKFKSESELIDDLVQCVWRRVQHTFLFFDSSDKLPGTDFELEQLTKLLVLNENDVRYIGITGMGGIGKTTLAKLVFDKIFHHFEVQYFLSNVREVSARHGTLVGLQKQLVRPIMKKEIAKVCNEQYGCIYIKRCLGNKKVLLVLDDVDKLEQLEMLAGNKDWFNMGSRILITTRNESLLVKRGISHEVKPLNYGAALELFSLNAFEKDQPEEEFLELSERFLGHAKGLPLALKVLGGSLFGKGRALWESNLENLGKISPDLDIFPCLKISYDGLSHMEKMVFLDVACSLKGKGKEQVIKILDCTREISSLSLIYDLVKKSLLIIDRCNCIGMHDLIQKMGLTIVNQESKEAGKRSRLWHLDDISHVLKNNMGTEAIEAIALRLPKIEKVDWSCEASFSKMNELRLLELDNLIISSGPDVLPNSLRIMDWSWYPSKSLPSSFEPSFLTELCLWDSNLVQLWDRTKNLGSLKRMSLCFSTHLTSTPDFRGISNLEQLSFSGCTDLVDIHTSIADLKKLKYLYFTDCKSIESLPSKLEMDSLIAFDLSGCSKVKRIPEFTRQMKNLSSVNLSGPAIEQIPSSIEGLNGLTSLRVSGCKSLGLPGGTLYMSIRSALHRTVGMSHPDPKYPGGLVLSSLSNLRFLNYLNLSDCDLYEGHIPNDFGRNLSSLEMLHLSGNNFASLPASIRHLSKLRFLELERCKSLQELLYLPENPAYGSLFVSVDDCTSLKRLLDPSKLSTRFADLHFLHFSALNCVRLVEDEGWINRIFSSIIKFATMPFDPQFEDVFDENPNFIICPGSEIPEWCSQQSEGDSINVELPRPSQSSRSNWIGIAFCVVFADQEYLDNPAALDEFDHFVISCNPGPLKIITKGHLVSEHLLVICLPRDAFEFSDASSSLRVSFETYYSSDFGFHDYTTCANVKMCGARLVYEQDLEELKRPLKLFKRKQRALRIFKQTQRALKIFRRTQPALKLCKRTQPALKIFKRMHQARKFFKRTQQALKIFKRRHEYDDGDETTQPLCKRRKQ